MNKAINEMDKVVQQSAANSEESSSAAEELAGQAQEMAAMVGRFQLNRQNSARSVASGSMSGTPTTRKPPMRSKQDDGAAMDIPPQSLIPLESDPDFAEF